MTQLEKLMQAMQRIDGNLDTINTRDKDIIIKETLQELKLVTEILIELIAKQNNS
jgi:hypothetical protein